MARNISTSGINELKIHDNISDSDILLYYRAPTTAERNGYHNMAIQRKGRKIRFRQPEARLHYGLKILSGFREGDFVRDVNGRPEPFSSDSGSPAYLPSWKDEIEKGAADLVMLLAAHVFDSSAEIDEPEEDEDEAGAAGDDAPGNSEETSRQ